VFWPAAVRDVFADRIVGWKTSMGITTPSFVARVTSGRNVRPH
jgi:hypothetical protein